MNRPYITKASTTLSILSLPLMCIRVCMCCRPITFRTESPDYLCRLIAVFVKWCSDYVHLGGRGIQHKPFFLGYLCFGLEAVEVNFL